MRHHSRSLPTVGNSGFLSADWNELNRMDNQQLQRIDNEVPAPVQAAPTTLMAVIARAASDPNIDVTKMERLMAMHERLVAREAEAAYNAAMKEVQSKVRYVQKDATNPQTNSRYTRLETLNAAVVPIATEHGFSMSYGTADCPTPDTIRITCNVQHVAGHSKPYQVDIPLDTMGPKGTPNKTRTHGYGSSLSYGRRYLTMLIFNVSTGDDDDGNAAGKGVEGPEVILGLKAMVWALLRKHDKVPSGGTWKHGAQWLVDETILDPDVPIADLDAKGWRAVLAATTKKLEGK